MMAANEPTRWSILHWLALVGFVFAVQSMLVFFVSDWALPPHRKFSDGGGVYSINGQQWRTSHRLSARDPSLFSRIHRRSFSGSLWEETLPPRRKYEGWTEPPRYYEGRQSIGEAVGKRPGGETFISPSVVSKPAPVLSESERPQKTTESSPFVLILGDVQTRLPQTYPALPFPSWPEETLPQPTVIEAAVDRLGRVQSAVVLSNSLPAKHGPAVRLSEPDAAALRWVRQLRFQSTPSSSRMAGGGFAWGKIIFHWSVRAPRDGSDNSP